MTLTTLLKSAARNVVGVAAGLALTFAIVDGATAQTAAPAVTPATGDGPALWLIQDDDSRIWLFGTVHVLRPNTPWGSAKVDQALAEADKLVLEITNPDDQAAAAPIIQQYGVSPQTPLSSLLTAEELAELDTAARSLGASAAQLDPLRPWLAGLTLSVAPIVAAGYDPQSGVDLVLRARAQADGKPVEGLETLEGQIRMLAGLSEETQLAFLRSAIRDYKEATTVLDGLVSAWAGGDVEGVEAIGVARMQQESEELYDALLTDRNRNWADQIQSMLAGSGDVFIAVGAAHLAGDDSVQEILEDRGVQAVRQ
ncbi:MAG: TraB/GumN family protein [Brevundimonas sp.]